MKKDRMFYRFALYGFLKNLRFFEPFILLIFKDEGGLSFLQIGLLYSIRDLAANILELPAGIFADAFGRRKSMVISFTSYIIAFIIFFIFSDFNMYALAMLFFAAGEAFRSGTHKALILEYLKLNQIEEYKVAYYGRTRAFSQLGSAVNSLIAAALVFYSGNYRYMFIASTIPYILDLINLATYPAELDGELTAIKRSTLVTQMKDTVQSFVGIFKDPHAMRAILNSASFAAIFKMSKDYLQPILKVSALALPIYISQDETKQTAVVVGIVYFAVFLLTSYASRQSDRFSQRFQNLAQAINTTFLAGAVFLTVAGISAWRNLTPVSIVVLLGFYVLFNVRKPMNVALISDQIAHKVMASGLSVEAQFTTLFVAILAPLLGALADHLGVGVALLIFGLGMAVLSRFTQVQNRRLVEA